MRRLLFNKNEFFNIIALVIGKRVFTLGFYEPGKMKESVNKAGSVAKMMEKEHKKHHLVV